MLNYILMIMHVYADCTADVARANLRKKLVQIPLISVEGHVFDEPNVDVQIPRQLDKVDYFVVVQPSHHHHVDLDGRKPRV